MTETSADDTNLRLEIAALKKRVGLNEGAVRLADPADLPADPPPTIEQQMTRFYQHFTRLDGLRGARSDGRRNDYVEPNGSRVHAYFATGKATLPPFPESEAVPLQGG